MLWSSSRTTSLYYLPLLIKFEGHTVSYRPCFFHSNIWPTHKAQGPVIEVEITRCPNLLYGHRSIIGSWWTKKTKLIIIYFIISIGNWIRLESTPRGQAVHTLECGPLCVNQPIAAYLVPEIRNHSLYCVCHLVVYVVI